MQTGDLAFSFIGRGENAISAVTEGYRGARVNHVGMINVTPLGVFVLEAFPPEVRLTQFDIFARRSIDDTSVPRFMLGRLLPEYRYLIDDALCYGIQKRNVPYDKLYLSGENELYCSELLVDMFRHANGGNAFFSERPMSFRDRDTGQIHEAWISYYQYFGMPVPEGEPGSNPGDLSKDERIEIYEISGNIPGFQPEAGRPGIGE